MRRAAFLERSMTRPAAYGPRSLMTTRTFLPVSRRVTRTTVPNGRVLWAAVRFQGTNRSPDAVGLPRKPGPYHDALPVSTGRRCAHAAQTRKRSKGQSRGCIGRLRRCLWGARSVGASRWLIREWSVCAGWILGGRGSGSTRAPRRSGGDGRRSNGVPAVGGGRNRGRFCWTPIRRGGGTWSRHRVCRLCSRRPM